MKAVRAYTERLEKVIDAGVELRHNMRVKTETKTHIIEQQRETIANQSQMINELEKELKELRIEAAEKRQARQVILDEKKQDKLLKLSHHKQEVLNLNGIIRKMKNYIKRQNGGVMPDDWKWGDE